MTHPSLILVPFTQEAFVPVTSNSDYEDFGTWEVPVSYLTSAEPELSPASLQPKLWIHQNVLLASHTVKNADEWMLVNPDAKGNIII
jgi:hypothetical protein